MERFKLSYTRTRRQKIIMSLAAIIVFVTTYALILPAITIDTDTAEVEPGMDVGTVETVELPAASLKESVEGITVSVEADAGVFPENTSLSLKVEDSGDSGLSVDQYEHVTISNEVRDQTYYIHRGEWVEVPVNVYIILKAKYPDL